MSLYFRKSISTAAAAFALAVSGQAENLLSNGSFEAESSTSYAFAQNWKMNDPDNHGDAWGNAGRENWRAKDGAFIMAIRGLWVNMGDNGGVWQEAEGRPGQTYRLSAWFWADSTWSPHAQEMKIEFWNRDHSEMLGSTAQKIEGVGEDWKEISLTAIAPEGTEWVRAVFLASGVSGEGSLQIDDASLELVSASPATTESGEATQSSGTYEFLNFGD